MNEKILLTNIQKFSLHDGPGIRTTIFLKGCSLRCPWCSNPENIEFKEQNYIKDGVAGIYGKWMTCDEIYAEIIKDIDFYGLFSGGEEIKNLKYLEKLPGGVTFSGGEPLLQIDKLVSLLKKLKTKNIHTAVETCLYVENMKLEISIKYIDLFYVDAKILSESRCKETLKGNIHQFLDNLSVLYNSKKPFVIRIPVIGDYTDGADNRKAIIQLLIKYRPIKVELIKEHSLGITKYTSLGLPIPMYKGVSDKLMEQYKKEIEEIGLPVEICKI